MTADYCWLIKLDIPEAIHKKSLLGLILCKNEKDIIRKMYKITFVVNMFFPTVSIKIFLIL